MPHVKYFEIVRNVINENIQNITMQKGLLQDEAYQEVVRYLKQNSAQWSSGRQPVICYHDPLCRIAYLYGIVPANANLVEIIFSEDRELREYINFLINKKSVIIVSAFGGGPGTELLGIIKYLEYKRSRFGKPIYLDFLILDRVTEWLDSWLALKREIERRFENNIGPDRNTWPVIFSGNFSGVDITNTSNFGNLGNLFMQDICILSYLLSEIFDVFDNFIIFLKDMVTYSAQGSKFLFIDRRGPIWENRVREISERVGLELSEFQYTRRNMDPDEQVTDLGKLYEDVGRSPRVTWDAFWVVGIKR